MEIPFILKPVFLFILSVFLIRLTGSRSIAQMSVAQTVMVFALGTIIVEPFCDQDIIKTAVSSCVVVALLIVFELLAFYFKGFKKLAVGKSVVIIRNGNIDEEELKKLRLTKDEVLSRIRNKGIFKLSNIEKGVLEANGEFSFKLTKAAEPITVEDMVYILNALLSDEANQEKAKQIETFLKKKDKGQDII